jgi:hypothetical protein
MFEIYYPNLHSLPVGEKLRKLKKLEKPDLLIIAEHPKKRFPVSRCLAVPSSAASFWI